MPRSIALLVGAETRTLTLDSRDSSNKLVFTEKTGPLVGRLRLTARIAPNGAGTVLRNYIKLEQASVVDGTAPTGGTLPMVQYTQVWSHDVSVVTASSGAKRNELYDLQEAILANEFVRSMVVDGVQLDA